MIRQVSNRWRVNMFDINDYVIYKRRNRKYVAIVDEISTMFAGSIYITLCNGEKIITNQSNLEKLETYIIPGDYISVINASLDSADEEWFNDLYDRYIKFTKG
jgi:hypothetical protein